MFRFQKKYGFLTVLLFLIEVFIAVYVHDDFVRPYGGDFLVVIFIYCFVKSFLNISPQLAAISVLLFSFAVEVLQNFNLVHYLGLQDSRLATIIIGTSFAWLDLLSYTLGIWLVLIIEYKKPKSELEKPM